MVEQTLKDSLNGHVLESTTAVVPSSVVHVDVPKIYVLPQSTSARTIPLLVQHNESQDVVHSKVADSSKISIVAAVLASSSFQIHITW